MRPDGHLADLHDPRRGIDIHHNLRGGRQIIVERKDHSRVFVEHGRPGYIERSYGFHGHDFARRTYAFHGRTYERFYGSYGFHGVHLAVYAPTRYYAPGFYGWAYHPYVRPAPYAWGFTTAPWYHPYATYFAPAPIYPGPSLWLSDYLLSASLAADYQAQVDLGQAATLDDPSPITDDVRQEIGDEVQEQIALENSEAVQNSQGQDIDPGSSSIARLLSDGKQHVLVAGEEVDVVDSNGQECAVTEGDVVQIGTAPAPDASTASAVLLASKGGRDCKRGSVVSVPMDALQEMQNHMREVVDEGLAELQAKQGAGMIPAAPLAANASAPPVTAAFAAIAPPPDPSAADDIAKEEKDADKSEKDLMKEAAKGSSDN